MEIPDSMISKSNSTRAAESSLPVQKTTIQLKNNKPKPVQFNSRIKHVKPFKPFSPLPPPPPSPSPPELLPLSTYECMLKYRMLSKNYSTIQSDFKELSFNYNLSTYKSTIAISSLAGVLVVLFIILVASNFVWFKYNKKKIRKLEANFRERVKNIVTTPNAAIDQYKIKG
jgi:hypothetical protein